MESQANRRRQDEPHQLGEVLSHLFALRGYGRTQSGRQLADVWRMIAGEQTAANTRVQGIKAGVLQIGVRNSALLHELHSFHKGSLLECLRRDHGDLGITDIKFRLNATARTP